MVFSGEEVYYPKRCDFALSSKEGVMLGFVDKR